MRIGARYNGPPSTAHGGVAVGVFAQALDPMRATVRLTQPPPLEEDLDVVDAGDGVRAVVAGSGTVATVSTAALPDDLPDLPLLDPDQLERGRTAWLTDFAPRHPFPTCFGCGHERADDDGLSMFPGPIPGTDLRGSAWTPDGPPGAPVPPWLVWAAVDCPSGSAVMSLMVTRGAAMLAEMSFAISELPEPGGAYQVVAQPLGRDRRKLRSHVAVVADDGRNIARGLALWIALDR